MATHRVPQACEDTNGIMVENDSEATEYKTQPPSNSIVQPPSERRGEMEGALADLNVVTETEAEAIFENRLPKWTNTLQTQIVKLSSLHSKRHFR